MPENRTPHPSSSPSSLKPKPAVAHRPTAAFLPEALPKVATAAKPVGAPAAPVARNTAVDLSTYVPSFVEMRARTGLAPKALNGATVTIPTALFRLLIGDILRRQAFDQDAYLAANPDVARAMRTGSVTSAHDHYMTQGYFEGRVPGPALIDEAWYLRTNPDVAKAVRDGTIRSAVTHYEEAGHREGRLASADAHQAKRAWDAALNKR